MNLGSVNLNIGVQNFQQLSQTMNQAAQAMRQMNWNAGTTAGLFQGPPKPGWVGGAWQKLMGIQAASAWNQANVGGMPVFQADIDYAQWKTMRQIRRQASQMQWSWLTDPLNSMMKFNRWIFYAHMMVRAFEHFVQNIGNIFDLAKPVIQGALTSGSFAGYGGRVAGAFGVTPQQMASDAASFRGRLVSDPMAMMAFGAARLPPEFGGRQDLSRDLWIAVRGLSRIRNDEARILQARRLGLESYLPMSYAHPLLMGLAERQGRDREMSALNYRTYMANRDAMREFRNQAFGEFAQRGIPIWTYLQTVGNVLLGGTARIGTFLLDNFPFSSLERKPVQGRTPEELIMSNTVALRDLAMALQGATRGVWGGGLRARQAIPPGVSGFRLQQAIKDDTIRMGAITL